RPSPISSSHRRRLPTPAAASTFCRRTPPGTSMSESCPGSSVGSVPCAVLPPALSAPPRMSGRLTGRGRPPRRSRPSWARPLIARTARVLSPAKVQNAARTGGTAKAPGVARVQSAGDAWRVLLGAVGILDLVGQERREVGQLIQAGQAEALEEVR